MRMGGDASSGVGGRGVGGGGEIWVEECETESGMFSRMAGFKRSIATVL